MTDMMIQANGLPFHIIEDGTGPAVLFCHGFPDTAETWRSQIRAVANAGFRAVALDMRGYGRSYAPDRASLYSAPHTVGDLVGVLDALDIASAVLVGHDWGADVAQRAAVMRPDLFPAIVSLSIPFAPRGDVSFYGGLRQRGLEESFYAFGMMNPTAEADFEPAASTIPRILYWLSASPRAGERWTPDNPSGHMLRPAPVALPTWADPDYVRHTIRAFEATGFRGGLNYYRAAEDTFELLAAFKHALVQQPSLYIWGVEDGLCRFIHPDPPSVDEVRKLAPGIVDVVCIENAGHWVQHEAREQVNSAVIAFLSAVGWAEKGR